MSKYTILLTKSVQKQLTKIPTEMAERLEEAMLSLEDNPRHFGCEKLKGREGHRIRVGNYRFIYEILDELLIVRVVKVGHRKDIYD